MAVKQAVKFYNDSLILTYVIVWCSQIDHIGNSVLVHLCGLINPFHVSRDLVKVSTLDVNVRLLYIS